MEVILDNQGEYAVEATIQTQIFELDPNNKPGTKVTSLNPVKVKIEAGKSINTEVQAIVKNPKR